MEKKFYYTAARLLPLVLQVVACWVNRDVELPINKPIRSNIYTLGSLLMENYCFFKSFKLAPEGQHEFACPLPSKSGLDWIFAGIFEGACLRKPCKYGQLRSSYLWSYVFPATFTDMGYPICQMRGRVHLVFSWSMHGEFHRVLFSMKLKSYMAPLIFVISLNFQGQLTIDRLNITFSNSIM